MTDPSGRAVVTGSGPEADIVITTELPGGVLDLELPVSGSWARAAAESSAAARTALDRIVSPKGCQETTRATIFLVDRALMSRCCCHRKEATYSYSRVPIR